MWFSKKEVLLLSRIILRPGEMTRVFFHKRWPKKNIFGVVEEKSQECRRMEKTWRRVFTTHGRESIILAGFYEWLTSCRGKQEKSGSLVQKADKNASNSKLFSFFFFSMKELLLVRPLVLSYYLISLKFNLHQIWHCQRFMFLIPKWHR